MTNIDIMYKTFGRDPCHVCRECSNYQGRCTVSGGEWPGIRFACGLFGREYNGPSVQHKRDTGELVGQMGLFD